MEKKLDYLRITKEKHGLDYKKAKQLASFLNKASVNNQAKIIKKLIY